jgi:hypothetical protein
MDETLRLVIEYMPIRRWIWDLKEGEGAIGKILKRIINQILLIVVIQNMAHHDVFNNTNAMTLWVR